MARAFLSLGSSLGDRRRYFAEAVALLEQFGVHVTRWSSLYETEPFYYDQRDQDQPWYLNAVVEVETEHSPQAVLLLGHEVESRLGRTFRSEVEEGVKRYLPRTIDVDLLFYEDEVIESRLLTLPHPRFHERSFTLLPMMELAPDWKHPVLNQTVKQLYESCEDRLAVKRLDTSPIDL
jgi:2-amino-4-hydroxy-6-hydroxymethyldihydropteridine diphosphokinase